MSKDHLLQIVCFFVCRFFGRWGGVIFLFSLFSALLHLYCSVVQINALFYLFVQHTVVFQRKSMGMVIEKCQNMLSLKILLQNRNTVLHNNVNPKLW